MPNPLTPSENAQIRQACVLLERHLGEALLAIHLFGSAVVGGLKPSSDLDLLVTVRAPLTEPARQALMTELLLVSAPPSNDALLRPLEVTVAEHAALVPWRHPAHRVLQFGEWLRADLLAGRFEPPMQDPDLAILLTKARAHSIALRGPEAAELLPSVPAADLVAALLDTVAQWNAPGDWAGDERNIVLALARILYTAETGQIASKDVASAWLMARLPPDERAILLRARKAYLGEGVDDLAGTPEALADFILRMRADIATSIARSASD